MNITCPGCGLIFVLELSPQTRLQQHSTVGEECPDCGLWLDVILEWDGAVTRVLAVEVQPEEFQTYGPGGSDLEEGSL